jgi:hypothetical protein
MDVQAFNLVSFVATILTPKHLQQKGETEPAFPKPIVTELLLKMPTLYQDTAAGKHEEAWLRQKILSGLSKDEKMATLFERTDNVVAKKEVEMDKLALQMIDVSLLKSIFAPDMTSPSNLLTLYTMSLAGLQG